MEEKKFIQLKKNEFDVKEFVKRYLGKGKISGVKIEYTPIGEKIIVSTNKPGIVIGRRGEKIMELTEILKNKFKLENPHIEIQEIVRPEFDPQIIADDIANGIERAGPLKFKIIAYRTLDKIMNAGALGAELRLSGRLPSERARRWRFASGYLKKSGDSSKIVRRAEALSFTSIGVIGVKVAILPPDAEIHDKIEVNEKLKESIKRNLMKEEDTQKNEKIKKNAKTKK